MLCVANAMPENWATAIALQETIGGSATSGNSRNRSPFDAVKMAVHSVENRAYDRFPELEGAVARRG
jgi:hypothetical protein